MITPAIGYEEQAFSLATLVAVRSATLVGLEINADGLTTAYYDKPRHTMQTLAKRIESGGGRPVSYGLSLSAGYWYLRFYVRGER